MIISKRRLEAIRLDIETLERTDTSSLTISADLTRGMVEMIIKKLKGEYPHASDKEILILTRNFFFKDRS